MADEIDINKIVTKTDKEDFEVGLVDNERYQSLPEENKEIFVWIRNSFLEIMPLENGKFSDISLKYAENFAFIGLEAFNKFYINIVDTKLKEFEKRLQSTTSTNNGTTS